MALLNGKSNVGLGLNDANFVFHGLLLSSFLAGQSCSRCHFPDKHNAKSAKRENKAAANQYHTIVSSASSLRYANFQCSIFSQITAQVSVHKLNSICDDHHWSYSSTSAHPSLASGLAQTHHRIKVNVVL